MRETSTEEGGTRINSITENFMFFLNFPFIFLDPLKNLKIWQIYRAKLINPLRL